jgi:prepilin-type N-terminal cleavage/methylation domain-containing protein
MKNPQTQTRQAGGFTLIELLVVIAIIAILAALLLPVGAKIQQNAAKSRARAELMKVDSAINDYKTKLGHYPPDNTNSNFLWRNQLYYELLGCRRSGANFVTLDGASQVSATDLAAYFNASGIVNTSVGGGGDEGGTAQPFLKEIKQGQYDDIMVSGTARARVLGVSLDGPVPTMIGKITPFSYNSSSPTHNINSFDLWVDVKIGGKTNRINNWSAQPEIVP